MASDTRNQINSFTRFAERTQLHAASKFLSIEIYIVLVCFSFKPFAVLIALFAIQYFFEYLPRMIVLFESSSLHAVLPTVDTRSDHLFYEQSKRSDLQKPIGP